jgi:hypothetical protein
MVLSEEVVRGSQTETTLKPLGGSTKKISSNRTKSLVIQDDNEIYESPIDSLTLYKRDDVLLFFNREGEESS